MSPTPTSGAHLPTPRGRSVSVRIIATFVPFLVAFILIGYAYRRSVDAYESAAQWTRHSVEVQRALESLELDVSDAHQNARSYTVTGDDRFMGAYRQAVGRAPLDSQRLRELVSDDVEQTRRAAEVDRTAFERLAFLRDDLDAFHKAPTQQRSLDVERAQHVVDAMRTAVTDLRSAEEVRLQTRTAALHASRIEIDHLQIYAGTGIVGLTILMAWLLVKSLTEPLAAMRAATDTIGSGNLAVRLPVNGDDELAQLASAFNRMTSALQSSRVLLDGEQHRRDETARLVGIAQGHLDVVSFAHALLPELVQAVGGVHGALFVARASSTAATFQRVWVFADDTSVPTMIRTGEGLLGEAARSDGPIVLHNLPDDFFRLCSGIGPLKPASLRVHPLIFQGETLGILELGFARNIGAAELSILTALTQTLAPLLHAFRASERTSDLLREAQALTAELQRRTRDLSTLNEEVEQKNHSLEEQGHELKASELTLRDQQDELQALNEELEEQTILLSKRNAELERKNSEIEEARTLLEAKIEELRLSTTYKSQFLANVSHELRTPLNSQLILSRLLVENREGRLSPKEVEYLTTIHKSGMDLLRLVDDVLDLAKVEAGKIVIYTESVSIAALLGDLHGAFAELAMSNGLSFSAHASPSVPDLIVTDPHRLRQILKNLVGNAIKFTKEGGVRIEVSMPPAVAGAPARVAFAVIDTGIGVAETDREGIFEAFRQSDGSTSRAYGGTGLGLSISRQLATLLGGEIALESEQGRGSTFTLFLRLDGKVESVPASLSGVSRPATSTPRLRAVAPTAQPSVADTALIVASDAVLAHQLAVAAEQHGLTPQVIAYDPGALTHLGNHLAAVVIAPTPTEMATASLLQAEAEKRRLPHHIVGATLDRKRAIAEATLFFHSTRSAGGKDAMAASRDVVLSGRKVLLVDDDLRNIYALTAVLEREGMIVAFAENGEEGIRALEAVPDTDVVLMDIMMPKMDGYDAIRTIRLRDRFRDLPIIAVTAKAMDGDRQKCLEAGAVDYIAKPVQIDQLLSLLRVWLYDCPAPPSRV